MESIYGIVIKFLISKLLGDDPFWETVRTVFYAVLIAVVVRTFAYEPFNIPSGSMYPNLKVGRKLHTARPARGLNRQLMITNIHEGEKL